MPVHEDCKPAHRDCPEEFPALVVFQVVNFVN
jgi:hypothetical protein